MLIANAFPVTFSTQFPQIRILLHCFTEEIAKNVRRHTQITQRVGKIIIIEAKTLLILRKKHTLNTIPLHMISIPSSETEYLSRKKRNIHVQFPHSVCLISCMQYTSIQTPSTKRPKEQNTLCLKP